MVSLDRHLRVLLDEAPAAILVEAGDRIVYLNDAYARLLGYRNERELAHASIRDIATEADLDRLAFFGRCRAQARPAPTSYVFCAHRRDRSIVTIDATIWTTRIDGQLLIATLARPAAPRTDPELAIPGLGRLSVREREVLLLIMEGLSSKEIACRLDVGQKTIGTFKKRIFTKLALRNDRDLFRFVAESRMAS